MSAAFCDAPLLNLFTCSLFALRPFYYHHYYYYYREGSSDTKLLLSTSSHVTDEQEKTVKLFYNVGTYYSISC